MKISKSLFDQMCISLEKSVAVYQLLHAHARGETDLSEDQLANVVTGVNMETGVTLSRAYRQTGEATGTRRRGHGAATLLSLPVG